MATEQKNLLIQKIEEISAKITHFETNIQFYMAQLRNQMSDLTEVVLSSASLARDIQSGGNSLNNSGIVGGNSIAAAGMSGPSTNVPNRSPVRVRANIGPYVSSKRIKSEPIETEQSDEVEKFKCRYCDKEYTWQKDLNRHVRKVHVYAAEEPAVGE